MSKLPSLHWSEVAGAFAKAAWQHNRTKASHFIMTRPGQPGLLSIPMHDPVKKGTLRSLIRNAGLSVDEFLALLS